MVWQNEAYGVKCQNGVPAKASETTNLSSDYFPSLLAYTWMDIFGYWKNPYASSLTLDMKAIIVGRAKCKTLVFLKTGTNTNFYNKASGI